ncbi:MAG: hypothetical protein LBQ20_02625 [Rhodanobacter sp.]|jgi:hypothetical protein|nr:hypothetical protein [Rhodanobacter sp.]
MKKYFMAFLVFLYLYTIDAHAADSEKPKITIDQARALVWASLEPGELQLPNIQILSPKKNPENIASYEDSKNPRYLKFNVIWDGTPDGSIEVGFFAVDAYTGDVFDPVSGCAEYGGKKLETLQRKVRRSLHLTQAAYKKLKTRGPMCDD